MTAEANVVTVNCARIIHGNQVATNGVVHVIDRVIRATGSTIQSYVEVDDELTTLAVSLQPPHPAEPSRTQQNPAEPSRTQ
uniref:FAS1 domain-containing protein n=1 Tax=Knipowitschia caucasica TaxID=637954 RepID=A0AAV2J649_KNICA